MIEAELYKRLADAMGELYTLGDEAVEHLQNISTIFAETDVPAQKATDVDNAVAAVGNAVTVVSNRHVVVSPALRKLVRAIQEHVESRFGGLDDFLDAEGVLVSADFAFLSEECGYPISPGNIAS